MRVDPLLPRRCLPLLLPVLAGVLLVVQACEPEILHSPADPSLSEVRLDQEATTNHPDVVDDTLGTDVQAFADTLRQIDKGLRVLVAAKDPGVPPYGPNSPNVTSWMAVPVADTGVARWTGDRYPEASSASFAALRDLLIGRGAEIYWTDPTSSLLAARLSHNDLVPTLERVLSSSLVAYVEAVVALEIEFDAAPVGANDTAVQHSFHDITFAWDSTRGNGVEIGILDSGVAHDGSWAPDLEETSDTLENVVKKGFVDLYHSCDQAVGSCEARDDHGTGTIADGWAHGSYMVSVAGGNDDEWATVGVAPAATIYSMKITYDKGEVGLTDDDEYAIDNDDWTEAVSWARTTGLDILSMSFSRFGPLGATVANQLEKAYHDSDILLLSSTPNGSTDRDTIASKSYVMGVGGVLLDGTNAGSDHDQEISALFEDVRAAPVSVSSCEPGFCDPITSNQAGVHRISGTSAATALAAGIAGLVRAYWTDKSASQVRDRLRETASGAHDVVNAWDALFGNPGMTVDIGGPTHVKADEWCIWTAEVSGGTSPYTYAWYRDGAPVGTDNTYTASSGSSDFQLELEVDDAFDWTSGDQVTVRVDFEGDSCGI